MTFPANGVSFKMTGSLREVAAVSKLPQPVVRVLLWEEWRDTGRVGSMAVKIQVSNKTVHKCGTVVPVDHNGRL